MGVFQIRTLLGILLVVLRIEYVHNFPIHTFPTRTHKKTSQWSPTNKNRSIPNNRNNNDNINRIKDPLSVLHSNARCVAPQNIALDVLYEDIDMLVVNKPPGMIMQFVPGSVENAVVFYLNATASKWPSSPELPSMYGSPSWPWKTPASFEGIVHRIDKDTSGILVVAKHPLAARTLHASFKERRVHKTYLAIARGLPTKEKLISYANLQSTKASINGNEVQSPQQLHALPLLLNTPSQRRLSKEIKNCGCDADKALELLHRSTDANALCFNAALSVCKRAGLSQRHTAFTCFDLMKERGVTPNAKCFLKAINLCTKKPPMYEKAIELVGYMNTCYPDLAPNPNCVSMAISACGHAGQLEPVLELLHLVDERRSDYSDVKKDLVGCFNAAIRACERIGAIETSLSLKNKLQIILSEPDTVLIADLNLEQSLNENITVNVPIGKLGSRRRLMGVLSKAQGGRDAWSIISPLAYNGVLSLNSIVIETGRTHQIRVHMASVLGCPLAGDNMYNEYDGNHDSNSNIDIPIIVAERCMLHAVEIIIPHPTTGTMLKISCPPPPDFTALAGTITL